MRRILAVLAALLFVPQIVISAPPASANALSGAWSAPSNLGTIGIHSTLLRTGKVMLFGYSNGTIGTETRLWNPATGALTNVTMSRKRELFCSGHSVLPDGRVFVTGGTVYGSPLEVGVRNTDLFDPVTGTWQAGPQMNRARWYPSNLGMPSGKTLIFSGQKDPQTLIRAVESHTPGASAITMLPSTANKTMWSLYPHLFVMPNGKVFYANADPNSSLFNPATNSWSFVDDTVAQYRYSAPAVLLPGLQKVLFIGGDNGNSALASAEIIDLSQPSPRWRATAPMSFKRRHANGVLLPDGKVLVVGGGLGESYANPVKAAEMFDPATETWQTMAAQQAGRMYHSTAVLLPDGRVLSAGQDSGSYQYRGEVFSPPYLFKGPRPVIDSAPGAVGYNRGFSVATDEAVGRVVLIRPGSVTHSTDFEQRYVNLPFTAGSGVLNVTSPPNANHAPPGWYMLFIVNTDGVPSIASWVRVG